MTAAAEEMDEVVVVAYGRAKKASYTGSATTIKGVSKTEQLQTFFLELRDLFRGTNSKCFRSTRFTTFSSNEVFY
jgi:hypothetical protein